MGSIANYLYLEISVKSSTYLSSDSDTRIISMVAPYITISNLRVEDENGHSIAMH